MDQYTIDKLKEDIDKLRKQNVELLVENRIQTLAVLLFFFFGVATIYDLVRKK